MVQENVKTGKVCSADRGSHRLAPGVSERCRCSPASSCSAAAMGVPGSALICSEAQARLRRQQGQLVESEALQHRA